MLHHDWKHILLHAWSVRLIILAAVLSAVEVALPLIQPYVNINPIYVGVAAGLASAGAFFARIFAQKKFVGR